MDSFFLRVALIGSFVSTMAACTAGNYDLPACGTEEKCGNGIDDDCDGMIDNSSICSCPNRGDRQDCPARVGIVTKTTSAASYCTEKTKLCLDSLQWSECSGIDPIPEQCFNSVDDDCDGQVDEQDCVPCIDNQEQNLYSTTLVYGPKSKCVPGREICKSGRWEPKILPVPFSTNDATCDDKDDDCDGKIDEDAVWRSGTMSFTTGQRCWDISKVGACRTVGTVVCNASTGVTSCNNPTQSPQTIYRKESSSNALLDPTNPSAAWDLDCDGKVESIFCTGSSVTCSTSNISKTIYVAYDSSTNCSVVKPPYCSGSVLIRATIQGASLQCGSAIQVTECEAPIIGIACVDKANPQDGFMYCK